MRHTFFAKMFRGTVYQWLSSHGYRGSAVLYGDGSLSSRKVILNHVHKLVEAGFSTPCPCQVLIAIDGRLDLQRIHIDQDDNGIILSPWSEFTSKTDYLESRFFKIVDDHYVKYAYTRQLYTNFMAVYKKVDATWRDIKLKFDIIVRYANDEYQDITTSWMRIRWMYQWSMSVFYSSWCDMFVCYVKTEDPSLGKMKEQERFMPFLDEFISARLWDQASTVLIIFHGLDNMVRVNVHKGSYSTDFHVDDFWYKDGLIKQIIDASDLNRVCLVSTNDVYDDIDKFISFCTKISKNQRI